MANVTRTEESGLTRLYGGIAPFWAGVLFLFAFFMAADRPDGLNESLVAFGVMAVVVAPVMWRLSRSGVYIAANGDLVVVNMFGSHEIPLESIAQITPHRPTGLGLVELWRHDGSVIKLSNAPPPGSHPRNLLYGYVRRHITVAEATAAWKRPWYLSWWTVASVVALVTIPVLIAEIGAA